MPGVEKAAAAVLGGSVPPQPDGGGAKAPAPATTPWRFASPPDPVSDASGAGGGPHQAARETRSEAAPARETGETLHALDAFRTVWLENERLIEEAARQEVERYGPKWQPATAEERAEYSAEQHIARHRYDEVLTPRLREACVVVLQGIIERELRRLVENLEHDHGTPRLDLKEVRSWPLLEQATKYLELFFNLRLLDCPQYGALGRLQQARDRIVHGRSGTSHNPGQDQDRRTRLQDHRPHLPGAKGVSLRVEPDSLERSVREAGQFFVWIFRQLNWGIEDIWRQKTWLEPSPAATGALDPPADPG
jgi:hypothetical protein